MRFASSKTVWLLLSVAVAFGALAWTAQHEPRYPILVRVGPVGSVTYTDASAGKGYFGRVPRSGLVVAGVDTFGGTPGKPVCTSVTWSQGKPANVTVSSQCVAKVTLRRVP